MFKKRRTVTDMLVAYYSKGTNSKDLFNTLNITQQSDTEVWFSLKNKDLNKQYVFKYKGNELIPDRLVD